MEMLEMLAKLIIGHWLMDYPLQGDFLAKAKNHKAPIPGVPWYHALVAHAGLQAGTVWLVTGSKVLGCCEFILHGTIDYLKNDERISYGQDQVAHILCKMAYVIQLWYWRS